MPNARYSGMIEKNESRLGNGSFLTYFFVGEKWGGGDRFFGGLSMIRKLNRKLNEKVKSIFKEKYGLLRFYYYICDVRKSNPYKFTQ